MTPAEALRDLPTPARNLAIGLGDRIGQPHVLDKALADYRAASAPCQSTWSRVTKSLRAYSTVAVGGNSPLHLPDALDDVPWSDLALYRTERDYQRFLVETDAPMEPCPAILAAWAHTTFHPTKPTACDLIGQTAPIGNMPWRNHLL